MSRWFCKFDGATSGPFSRDELEYLHDRGQLTASTEIRLDGERTWSRAGQTFSDLFPAAPVMVAEPPAPQVTLQPAPRLARRRSPRRSPKPNAAAGKRCSARAWASRRPRSFFCCCGCCLPGVV
jgi:hypothetical protein